MFIDFILRFIWCMTIFLLSNVYLLNRLYGKQFFILLLFTFVIINFMPSISNRKLETKRLRICSDGCELLILFCISTILNIVFNAVIFWGSHRFYILNLLIATVVETIVFLNGIIKVYRESKQLGIRIKVLGIVTYLIPIVNIIVLGIIINIVDKEVHFENNRILLNNSRKSKELCKTKYPILLVHGVFFRDYRYFNYWGRIPNDLKINGAEIFYGNHQSAASVENSAKELIVRIKDILNKTGSDKVNVIAHSKGGLDIRYAISMLGGDKYIASLTTINTPHRGCIFADYLLSKIPKTTQNKVARKYNKTLKKLGDYNPDFMEAVTDLTSVACNKRNKIVIDSSNVYYQSVGSILNFACGGRFPLNYSYKLVRYFDGPNDGLVGEYSFKWGENYKLLRVNGWRGISHGDMVDSNRENIDGFDVREFYVKLVNDLKKKGF